jgi:hypothetical protein
MDCVLELHVQGRTNQDWWFIKPLGINHLPNYNPPQQKKKKLRILALTWTTFDNETELMINQRGDLICPAADGLTNELLNLGHQVVYVNVAAEHLKCTEKQLSAKAMISGLPYMLWKDVKSRDWDIIWHCIKDPTPTIAIPYIEKIMAELDPKIPVWNNIKFMKDHLKRKYISLMRKKNVGAIILEDEMKPFLNEAGKLDYQNLCFPPSQSCYVTKDYYAIRLSNMNSGRIYPLFSPEGGVTLRYHNTAKYPNAEPGLRTFFRIPYAAGKCLEGWEYYCPEAVLCPKSGAAVKKIPFSISDMTAGTVSACMQELGVDLAHVEGIKAGFGYELFDCNIFPSSSGDSLTPLSRRMAQRLEQVYAI